PPSSQTYDGTHARISGSQSARTPAWSQLWFESLVLRWKAPGTCMTIKTSSRGNRFGGHQTRWSGGRDSNSRSPGPKPDLSAHRIRLDLSSTYSKARKSFNS